MGTQSARALPSPQPGVRDDARTSPRTSDEGDAMQERVQETAEAPPVFRETVFGRSQLRFYRFDPRKIAKAATTRNQAGRRHRFVLLSVCLGLFAVACDSPTEEATLDTTTTGDVPTTEVSAVAGIVIAPAAPAVQVGATAQLTADARGQNGNSIAGVTFTWASANAAVATVSASGLVTGVAAGQVEITASASGKTGSTNGTVSAAGN